MPCSWYAELSHIFAAVENPDAAAKRREALLRDNAAIYRIDSSPDASTALLAMFEDELLRLSQTIQIRIQDADDRRGLVTLCFLQTVANAEGGGLAVSTVVAATRSAVFKEIRRIDAARRREYPADFQSDAWGWLGYSLETDAAAEVFAERCRRIAKAMKSLPALEKKIVEAICLHGLSERAAAEKLGISRSMLKRRLTRAKSTLACGVGLPLPEPGKARPGSGTRRRGVNSKTAGQCRPATSEMEDV